jgi:hypothetical protein
MELVEEEQLFGVEITGVEDELHRVVLGLIIE